MDNMEVSYLNEEFAKPKVPELQVNNFPMLDDTTSTTSATNSNKDGDENQNCNKENEIITVDNSATIVKTNDNLNITVDSTCLSHLKKNLFNEEEFRTINHAEPIHIFLKLKPLNAIEMAKQNNMKFFKLHSDTGISLVPPKTSIYAGKQSVQAISNTIYQFSFIFQPEITQKDFFKATIYPCMEKFLNGDNLLIFSYGVTNSGKTYTMQGTNQNPGLIPRTLDFLFDSLKDNLETKRAIYQYKPDKFNEITSLSDAELNSELAYKEMLLKSSSIKDLERVDSFESLKDIGNTASNLLDSKKFGGSLDSLSTYVQQTKGDLPSDNLFNKIQLSKNIKYSVWISFYELYNDSVYDLLTLNNNRLNRNFTPGNERQALKIREDQNRVPYVEGLINIPIFNTMDAIKILKYGERNLQKSSNSINQSSSRSHAIFNLKLVTIESSTFDRQSTVSINQLSFCDLAGVERLSKTQAVGKTQKEASQINTSLLALSRCIETMMQNQKNKTQMQVPYRTNKLTRLFQPYFEGRGMVKMIVNLNPSANFFDENVGVLKFASIANQIQININDDDKIHYKIGKEEPVLNNNNNRLTVAWEGDNETTRMTQKSSDYDESDETDEEDEEDEEEESTEEESEEATEEEETEEDEDDDEEEETEEEEDDEEGTENSEEESDEEMDETAAKSMNVTNKTNKTTNKTTTTINETQEITCATSNATTEIEESEEDEESEESSGAEEEESTEEEETMEDDEEEETDEDEDEESGDEEEEDDSEEEETEVEQTTMGAETTVDLTTNASKIDKSALNKSKKKSMLEKSAANKSKNKSHLSKSAKKASMSAKKVNKSSASMFNKSANVTGQNNRLSRSAAVALAMANAKKEADEIEMEKLKTMSPLELVDIIMKLKNQLEMNKIDTIKKEAELRNDLVEKWSKRIEENELYYQNQMAEQKQKLDAQYANRVKMMEAVMERKNQYSIGEMRSEYENEMEKMKQNILVVQVELNKYKEDLTQMNRAYGELDSKYKEKLASSSSRLSAAANNRNLTRAFASGFETELRLDYDGEESSLAAVEKTYGDDENNETHQMEWDEDQTDVAYKAKKNTTIDVVKHEVTKNVCLSHSIQTSFSNYLFNQSMQTDTIRKVSIGLDADKAILEDLENYQSNLKQLIEQCEQLNQELSARSMEIDELRNDLENELKSKVIFQNEIEKLNAEIDQLKTKCAEKDRKCENLASLNQQMADENAKLEEKKIKLNQDLNEAVQNIKEFSNEYNKLKADQERELKKLNEKLIEKANEYNTLNTTHMTLIKKLEQMSANIDELLNKNESLKSEAKNHTALIEKLHKEIDTLKSKELTFKHREAELKHELYAAKEHVESLELAAAIAASTANIAPAIEPEKPPKDKKEKKKKSSVLPPQEEANEEEAPPVVKASKASSKTSRSSSSKQSLAETEAPLVSETSKGAKIIAKKVSKTKLTRSKKDSIDTNAMEEAPVAETKKKKSAVPASVEVHAPMVVEDSIVSVDTEPMEAMDDIVEEKASKKPAKTAVTKKKSTFDRITDMIAKSPILEPLRNRPTRLTKLKTTASNVSDYGNNAATASASVAVSSASIASSKSTTNDKKTKASSSKQASHEEEHAENNVESDLEEIKAKKPKKKRNA